MDQHGPAPAPPHDNLPAVQEHRRPVHGPTGTHPEQGLAAAHRRPAAGRVGHEGGGYPLAYAPSDTALEARGHRRKSLIERLFGFTRRRRGDQEHASGSSGGGGGGGGGGQVSPEDGEVRRQMTAGTATTGGDAYSGASLPASSIVEGAARPPRGRVAGLPPIRSTAAGTGASHKQHHTLGSALRDRFHRASGAVGGGGDSIGGPSSAEEEEGDDVSGRDLALASALEAARRQGYGGGGGGRDGGGDRSWAGYAGAHSFHAGEEMRTPSPIRGRRRSNPVKSIYVGQHCDVLYYSSSGMPGVGLTGTHALLAAAASASASGSSYVSDRDEGCGLGSSSSSGTAGVGKAPSATIVTDARSSGGGGGGIGGQLSASASAASASGGSEALGMRTGSTASQSPPSTIGGPIAGGAAAHVPAVTAAWLPARIVELKNDLVRLQVYVPPPGCIQTTQTVAGWLVRLGTDSATLRQCATSMRPHLEEVIIHLREVPMRMSFPAGMRSGVSGDDIKSLWPLHARIAGAGGGGGRGGSPQWGAPSAPAASALTGVAGKPGQKGDSSSGSGGSPSQKQQRGRGWKPSQLGIGGGKSPSASASLQLQPGAGPGPAGSTEGSDTAMMTPLSRPGLPQRFWAGYEEGKQQQQQGRGASRPPSQVGRLGMGREGSGLSLASQLEGSRSPLALPRELRAGAAGAGAGVMTSAAAGTGGHGRSLSAPYTMQLDVDFLLSLRTGMEVDAQESLRTGTATGATSAASSTAGGGGGMAAGGGLKSPPGGSAGGSGGGPTSSAAAGIIPAVGAGGRWRHAVICGIHTDRDVLNELRPEDTIGRGGYPVLPTLIAVDVLFTHSGSVETIPIASGRLARVHSKVPREVEPAWHAIQPGTFVDVVTLVPAGPSSAGNAAVSIAGNGDGIGTTHDSASAHQQQVVDHSNLSRRHQPHHNHHHHPLTAYDAHGRRLSDITSQGLCDQIHMPTQLPGHGVASVWRWAEVVGVDAGGDRVCVRYCSDDPEVDGKDEWIDMVAESYR